MAETNFRIFNEENAADKTYNDSEYEQATQRLGGVTPGMALSRLHNKLYLQTSVMAKAIADFLVKQGYDCYDNQATDITANLENAIKSFNASVVSESITAHNADTDAHTDFTGATAEKAGVRGMVPAPAAGDESKVLTGGKIWALIEDLNVALGNIAAPTADTAALKTLLGGMAYLFKAITGETDWKGDPKINLATLATLVGNLSSGSDVVWDGQKFTNAKLGVSGLMAQNGYIQFGPNFGGLIVQWGKNTEKIQLNKFNIAFKNACYYLKTSILNTAQSASVDNDWQIVNLSLENFELILQGYNDTNQGHFEGYLYIAIGR